MNDFSINLSNNNNGFFAVQNAADETINWNQVVAVKRDYDDLRFITACIEYEKWQQRLEENKSNYHVYKWLQKQVPEHLNGSYPELKDYSGFQLEMSNGKVHFISEEYVQKLKNQE